MAGKKFKMGNFFFEPWLLILRGGGDRFVKYIASKLWAWELRYQQIVVYILLRVMGGWIKYIWYATGYYR